MGEVRSGLARWVEWVRWAELGRTAQAVTAQILEREDGQRLGHGYKRVDDREWMIELRQKRAGNFLREGSKWESGAVGTHGVAEPMQDRKRELMFSHSGADVRGTEENRTQHLWEARVGHVYLE